MVIVSGAVHQEWWYTTGIDDDTLLAVSDTGYSSDVLSLEWLKHFDWFSAQQQNGLFRLLLLDGYGLHCTKSSLISAAIMELFCFASLHIQLTFSNHSMLLSFNPINIFIQRQLMHSHVPGARTSTNSNSLQHSHQSIHHSYMSCILLCNLRFLVYSARPFGSFQFSRRLAPKKEQPPWPRATPLSCSRAHSRSPRAHHYTRNPENPGLKNAVRLRTPRLLHERLATRGQSSPQTENHPPYKRRTRTEGNAPSKGPMTHPRGKGFFQRGRGIGWRCPQPHNQAIIRSPVCVTTTA